MKPTMEIHFRNQLFNLNNVIWFVDICCGFDADLSWICPETGDLPSMHIHLIQHEFSITCTITSTCVLRLKVAL